MMYLKIKSMIASLLNERKLLDQSLMQSIELQQQLGQVVNEQERQHLESKLFQCLHRANQHKSHKDRIRNQLCLCSLAFMIVVLIAYHFLG